MIVDHALLARLKAPEELIDTFALRREYGNVATDSHGRIDYSSREKDDYLQAPVSSFLAGHGCKPVYPNGYRWVLCLTHDIDDVDVPLSHSAAWIATGLERRQVRTLLRGIASPFDSRLRSAYRNFQRIMEIEDHFGAKSTFFFLARADDHHRRRYVAESLRSDLRDIVASGWDVGLHVAYEEYDNAAAVRDQKRQIEDIAGVEVLGARNHYLRFRTPVSWWVAAQSGLKYDSSLGFSDRIGFRNGTCHPFMPFDCVQEVNVPILEIPLAVMDAALLHGIRLKSGGARCFEAIKPVATHVASCGGVLTLLWHNDSFAAPWRNDISVLYEDLLSWSATHGAWLTSADSLCRWWRREQC